MNGIKTRYSWYGFLLLAGGLFSLPAFALPPQTVPPPTAGAILKQHTAPTALPTAPGDVLTLPPPKQQASQSTLAFKVSHVAIAGNTLLATQALRPLVNDLEGKTEQLSNLQAAAARITALYHARGYMLAYAYLPAQKIKGGAVTIQVVEPRYDHIHVKTKGRFATTQANKTLGLQPGQPVSSAPLQRGMLLLNQTPGVRVAGTLVPGSKAGTSSLDVMLHNTALLRGNAGLDDYGSSSTGRLRGSVQASLDDPFGHGGQIAANVMRTQAGLLKAEGLSLLSPDLWNGLRVGAYGSHVRYTLGGQFAVLHESGYANQYGIYASVPLVLAPGKILEARLDWLRDRFGQSSDVIGIDDHSHLDLLKLTVSGSLADAHGATSGGVVVVAGHKHIDSAAARLSDALGPQTRGNFWIGQVQVQRFQHLSHGFQLQAALSGQLASHNLDDSQKFYLGGPGGVMNVAVGEAGGDAGALARLGIFHAVPVSVPGHLSIGVLLQSGKVWLNHSRYTGAAADNQLDLTGGGLELAYHYNSLIDLKADYVRHLGDATLPSGASRSGEFWASLRVYF